MASMETLDGTGPTTSTYPPGRCKTTTDKKVFAVRMSYSLEMHMNIHGGGAFHSAECSRWRAT